MLANEAELTERTWEVVEICLSTVREGLNELRSMQKSVQRFTRRQMEEETLQGNLSVAYDDYSEQMSNSCYASLVRDRLPLRLPEAVRRIGDRLAGDRGALAAMQEEVLRRHPVSGVRSREVLLWKSRLPGGCKKFVRHAPSGVSTTWHFLHKTLILNGGPAGI